MKAIDLIVYCDTLQYWRKLPQVSFDATKHVFCRDKNIFVATQLLSRQIFVVANYFVTTNVLLRQAYFCRDKHVCLSRQNFCRDKHEFCRDKIVFVATKVLSRQAYFRRDKRRGLSRQKLYLWHLQPMRPGPKVGLARGRQLPWTTATHSLVSLVREQQRCMGMFAKRSNSASIKTPSCPWPIVRT